jgi:hypothetical protein
VPAGGGAEGPQPPAYAFSNPELITLWLASKPPRFEAQRVRFWFRRLAADPTAVEHLAIVTFGLPRCSTIVPGTNVEVAWSVVPSPPYAPEERCIILYKVGPVDPDLAVELNDGGPDDEIR